MKKAKYIFTALFLGVSIQFTACGTKETPKNTGQENAYRTELTEEEIKGGHVSFRMSENLTVDADVTPKEKYENGLSSYFLKVFYETDGETGKNFLKAPTVSLHSFEEWEEMLNKILPGKFKDNRFVLNKKDADIQQEYQGRDGNSYPFRVSWSTRKIKAAEKAGFKTAITTVGIEGGSALSNKAKNVSAFVLDYHGSRQDGFLQDTEKYIKDIKTFLTEISGREVYEKYDFSVVSRETIGMLNEAQPLMDEEEPEEEYAAFCFYYGIDGLPFKPFSLNYLMENNETADELCYWASMPGDRLTGLSEHEQMVLIDRDGVIYLECSNMWHTDGIYKEKLPVTGPNEALKQVKGHYDRQITKGESVITDIGLAYTGYFSDGADGRIRPVAAPFWVLKVYDGDIKKYIHFIYDAYSGECISEGV